MMIIYIALFVLVIKLIIDRINSKDSEEFDMSYHVKSFFKVFGGVALFFIAAWAFIIYNIYFDIEDEYERYFETPIELISDLEGFGMGFLDGYARFAFRSKKNIVLKPEDAYITVVDSIQKDKIIKDLIIKFTQDRYEKYFRAINNINEENSILKIHYRDSLFVDRKYLFVKDENINLFTVEY